MAASRRDAYGRGSQWCGEPVGRVRRALRRAAGVGEVERAVTRHSGLANPQVAPLSGADFVLNPRLLRSKPVRTITFGDP